VIIGLSLVRPDSADVTLRAGALVAGDEGDVVGSTHYYKFALLNPASVHGARKRPQHCCTVRRNEERHGTNLTTKSACVHRADVATAGSTAGVSSPFGERMPEHCTGSHAAALADAIPASRTR
jgi:hypothetical protein